MVLCKAWTSTCETQDIPPTVKPISQEEMIFFRQLPPPTVSPLVDSPKKKSPSEHQITKCFFNAVQVNLILINTFNHC
jgi:hypothetical protein